MAVHRFAFPQSLHSNCIILHILSSPSKRIQECVCIPVQPNQSVEYSTAVVQKNPLLNKVDDNVFHFRRERC